MNNPFNQQISQFIDHELDYDDSLNLLQNLQANTELIEQLQRYETISHALKTEQFLNLRPDFATKIAQQIAQEPSYFLPARKPQPASAPANRPYALLALAASVAVVAVLATTPNVLKRDQAASSLQVAQQSNTQIPQAADNTVQPPVYSLNAQISDYLQTHPSLEQRELNAITSVTAYPQK